MELWKSLREVTETVDASLPDPNGDHLAVHHHAGGRFRVFAPFHREGRPYLGSAEIELGPDELTPAPTKWTQALAQAAAVPDFWYPLGLPDAARQPSRTSTFDKQELRRWVEPVGQVIQQALRGEPVTPVREHLRFEKRLVQYRDSSGRELDEVRYSASLEVLLVPQQAPHSHPFVAELKFSEFAPEVITGFLRDQSKLTVDSLSPKPWEVDGEFQVLLRGAALVAVFDYLLEHLGGPSLAAGTSGLKLHRPLWETAARDPLTVTALAELYNSPQTGGFDDEGIVLQPRTLVKDGLVKGFWTTQPTAHWLGLPLTGRPRNYSVSPGSQSWDSLSTQRVLEVHRLRWAEVDRATGDFTAEVGLADLHEAGRHTPVFGFTVQGNVQQILTNALFSSDIGSWQHYEGPEFLVVSSSLFRSP